MQDDVIIFSFISDKYIPHTTHTNYVQLYDNNLQISKCFTGLPLLTTFKGIFRYNLAILFTYLWLLKLTGIPAYSTYGYMYEYAVQYTWLEYFKPALIIAISCCRNLSIWSWINIYKSKLIVNRRLWLVNREREKMELYY